MKAINERRLLDSLQRFKERTAIVIGITGENTRAQVLLKNFSAVGSFEVFLRPVVAIKPVIFKTNMPASVVVTPCEADRLPEPLFIGRSIENERAK